MRLDLVFTRISWGVAALIVLGTYIALQYLPETIPIHYNFKGELDRVGSKQTLWMFPILSVLLTGFFSLIRKYPAHMNYPFPLTDENRVRQQYLALLLLSTISLVTNIIFGYIVCSTLPSVQEGGFNFPILLILALVFVPIGVYFYLAFKAR